MTTKRRNRSAAEMCAFHMGWEIGEMRDMRYQSTVYRAMAIYSIDELYLCCPPAGKKPSYTEQYPWKPLAEYYGRTVYSCTSDEIEAHQNRED